MTQVKREHLKQTGYRIIGYRYDDDIDAVIDANADVFKKVSA